MRTLTKAIALAALCGAANPAMASEDTQYWQTATLNVALPDGFKIQNETVFRSGEAKGFYELENTLSVGKKVNKVVTLWLGYTFDPQYSHGNFTRREHRARQQVSFDNFAKLGKVKLSGRLRLEERWREGLPGTAWRLRPQVKASMPLAGKVNLSIANETFINFNNTAFQGNDGLDRMRNSISVSMPITKQITVEVGYLNQHTFAAHGTDNGDHVLTSGLSLSF
ncbi:DUF2490 domain-containing protein [Novosphingobium sp.]|uniref:DUF2490 domain-containing protein n=1 Tax=Novosphingobium sp. TaxID=1874826 RepID=UPI0025D20EC9|nr:DUF2490 domain-containing protein [Novosphingobium sp.]MCC6925813.1 DUF2490 domain-containing protein [Novosphingobium sp.]